LTNCPWWKNNHFRFSLSLFTFFTLRLFLEKWKNDFFYFLKAKVKVKKVKKSLFKSESESGKVKKSLF